jgi:RND family efflux transporter MFP subunit
MILFRYMRKTTRAGLPAAGVVVLGAVLTLFWFGGRDERRARAQNIEAPPAKAAPLRTAVRVRVAPVLEGSVDRTCTAAGVVGAFRRATVAAEATGRVVERLVEPGDVVESGQPLVLLDATRLRLAEEQARATLRSQEVDLAEARRNLERGDRLIEDDAISKSRHDSLRFAVERAASAVRLARVALRTTQRDLADAKVRAPFAGSIEAVLVDVGDHLSPGAPVATLVDLSRVRVRAGVTAAEAASLVSGSAARVVLADLGGVAIDGEVHSVGRVADPASGTFPVELWLPNPDGRLREGMVAQVQLPMVGDGSGLLVPRAALIRRGGETAVFVVDGGGSEARAVARPVRTGRSNEESVQILEGVAIGEEVVIDGLFALRDGAPVSVERTFRVEPSSGS